MAERLPQRFFTALVKLQRLGQPKRGKKAGLGARKEEREINDMRRINRGRTTKRWAQTRD
jgi:hypothetical protein